MNQARNFALLSFFAILFTGCASPPVEHPAPGHSAAIEMGRAFLTNLFDPEFDLLPEFQGAKVYWLSHDNYLAAKVLAASHPQISHRIDAAIAREGVREHGRIASLFGEAKAPLPIRQYQLLDVRRAEDKLIRTETESPLVVKGWQEYADLLFLASIAENDRTGARRDYDAAMRMWDGHGFLDAAARDSHQYATYKLGIALLAASRFSPPPGPPPGLLEKLRAMQGDSGGWITDYDAAGNRLGVANVETTCLVILGLESSDSRLK